MPLTSAMAAVGLSLLEPALEGLPSSAGRSGEMGVWLSVGRSKKVFVVSSLRCRVDQGWRVITEMRLNHNSRVGGRA